MESSEVWSYALEQLKEPQSGIVNLQIEMEVTIDSQMACLVPVHLVHLLVLWSQNQHLRSWTRPTSRLLLVVTKLAPQLSRTTALLLLYRFEWVWWSPSYTGW